MNILKNSPEDLIPDNINYIIKNGIKIRKGTMASAIANAEILESLDSSMEEKATALGILKNIAPQLKEFGLSKHLIWRNTKIQKIFDEVSMEDLKKCSDGHR